MEKERVKQPPGVSVDVERLWAFEAGLDPWHPEASTIPARVLGYGEISTVFALEDMPGLAFKRLPIFEAWDELDRYLAGYEGYIRVLEEDIGIETVPQGYVVLEGKTGRPVFYIVQEQVPAESVGHAALRCLGGEDATRVFESSLEALQRVWEFNRQQDRVLVGIDGQISNWSVQSVAAGCRLPEGTLSLLYMDTSTPLYRLDGVEQLDPELFLRSAPSFLRWVLRLFFLDDVVNRYYDFRLVVIDLLGNLHKEGIAELIPGLVTAANRFFVEQVPDMAIEPITEKEVDDYYQEDAFIWRLYLGMRRLDRWLHRALGMHYPYILPGKIKR